MNFDQLHTTGENQQLEFKESFGRGIVVYELTEVTFSNVSLRNIFMVSMTTG
jgi:hypothetical protein